MCTVVAAFKHFSSFPLIIAANRDEFLNRKTDPPALVNRNPSIFAPRDHLKSGTFMGINEWGLTAVITNLSGLVPKDNSKKSRGLILLRLLGSPSIDRLIKELRHIDLSEYNFFQILASDKEQIVHIKYDGNLKLDVYKNGIFILSNWDAISEVSDYKHSLIMSRIDEIDKNSDSNTVLKRLTDILTTHNGKDMRFQICVHTENYGTVSSFIIAPYQKEPIFYYSIGPVCKNRFRAYNQDIKEILKI